MIPEFPEPSEHGHRQVADLLPWYVNGTLAAEEAAHVREHLAGCVACRAEVEMQRRFARQVREADELALLLDRSWQRMAARLDADQRLPDRAAAAGGRRAARWLERLRSALASPALLRPAIAVQAAVIALLAAAFLLRGPEAPVAAYRTLSDPETTAAPAPLGDRILAVFADESPAGELRALLRDVGANVVAGPSSAGAFILEVPSGGQTLALARLREAPIVRFAEPASRDAPGS